jgi:hypothetical protein
MSDKCQNLKSRVHFVGIGTGKNGRLPDQRSGSPRREEVAPGPTRSAVNQNENGRNTLVKVKC